MSGCKRGALQRMQMFVFLVDSGGCYRQGWDMAPAVVDPVGSAL